MDKGLHTIEEPVYFEHREPLHLDCWQGIEGYSLEIVHPLNARDEIDTTFLDDKKGNNCIFKPLSPSSVFD